MELEYYSEGSVESDSEVKEYAQKAMENLRSGKCMLQNPDGTLRCPFCAGKKKQDYKYRDLLQHANGVSKGKRECETVGYHKALAEFLNANEELKSLAEPPKERIVLLEQETPQRIISEESLVWPWMGIIVNIDNSKFENGLCVGPGNSEIKAHFALFKPKSVHTFWNKQGHEGYAVIEFNSDIIGYGDAQDFERSFLEKGKGKRDWERRRLSHCLGKDLYGWIARQQDYQCQDRLGGHLRNRGSLRTVAQVSQDSSRKQDQLFQKLHMEVVDLQSLVTQADTARRQAEADKHAMEERHKQELRAVEQEAQKVIKIRNEETQKERRNLEYQMKVLQEQCKELKMQKVQNEVERRRYERERDKNEKDMQKYIQLENLYHKQEADQIRLIKKHEKENKKLLNELHVQKKKLANQQKLELQIQNLEALIATKKLSDDDNAEEYKAIKKMEEELNDLKDEMEGLQDMHTQLTYKERQLNDELQDALKEAATILKNHHANRTIKVKRLGELDGKPWEIACKNKYKNEDWQSEYATIFSEWEGHLRNGSWNPFKTICIGDDKWEKQIDEEDEKLSNLKKDLGEDVYKSVVAALNELEEYNPSGRYPVPAVWNFKENRRATMKEILNHLYDMLKTNSARKKRKNLY